MHHSSGTEYLKRSSKENVIEEKTAREMRFTSAFAFFFADIIFCQYAYTVFLLLQVPTSVNKYSIVCLHKIKENTVVLL